jgi:hypothetical protein
MSIRFSPRWKEELVAESAEGTLVFEFTMGVQHVYFPSKTLWQKEVPAWAQPRWEEYLAQCTEWCSRNHVPISVVDNTFVYQQH